MKRAIFCLVLASTVFADARPSSNPDRWIQDHHGDRPHRELDDETIQAKITNFLADDRWEENEDEPPFESLLVEIAQREPDAWEDFLTQSLHHARKPSNDDGDTMADFDMRDLEILTTLRRIQRKPQPLWIEVAAEDGMEFVFPELPVVDVSVRRHPEESEDFMFTFGGSYRSGRQARWSVLVWNHHGELQPRRLRMGMIGGGIYHRAHLGDQTWETTLSFDAFLETPVRPGKYWGVIAYHDDVSIADLEAPSGRVTSYSAPFEFTVTPRILEPSGLCEDKIKELLHALPKDGAVHILAARYDESWNDFIPLESAAGQLLRMGWDAIPIIARHLGHDDLTATQRAWGFGILFSLSSCMDPTQPQGVVGDHAIQRRGFWISHRTDGRPAGGGGGAGSLNNVSGRNIDPNAQQSFLDAWQDLIASTLVTRKPDPAPDAAAGADDEALARARTYHAQHLGLSMLVMHRGEIIFEAYDNGGDAETRYWLASGTKSFVGVLAAAAVEDGLIQWDQPASDILTEWQNVPAKNDITLRQLLNLTSGLRANPPGGARVGHSLAGALDAPVVTRPGVRFSYGANHFHAFAAALDRVLKRERDMDIEHYLNERILAPLGIGVDWQVRLAEGLPQLAGGGKMTARDWAVFGEFMRRQGQHGDTRIIAAEHLAKCLTGTDANPAYGLTWWRNADVPQSVFRDIPLLRRELGNLLGSAWVPEDLYLAAGAGKQRLYVIPSLELVVVRQGRIGGRNFRDEEFLELLIVPNTGD